MEYKFNINATEEEYLEFNKFVQLRSHDGKKKIRLLRVFIIVMLIAAFLVTNLISGEFTADALYSLIFLAIVCCFVQILVKPFLINGIKAGIKNMKKSGKPLYTASSVMEFGEETFTEVTEENKTESKYSAIERVSVVDGKCVYLHINRILAFIIPNSAFESKIQFDSFVEFIKGKVKNVDIY